MNSNKSVIILFFIALVGIGCTLVFFYTKKTPQISHQTTNNYQPQIITPSPTTLSTLTLGNSDQQLNQDNQSIDDSFNSLDADLHTVDQSLSDQSTNLQ